MRPSILNPLFAAITTLPGIGDKVARLYRRLTGREGTPRVVDLVFHLPTGARGRCCAMSCPAPSSPSR